MSSNAASAPRDRPDREGSVRRAVPLAPTAEGPRPDATALAAATRPDGEEDAERPDRGRPAASNRTTADDPTQ